MATATRKGASHQQTNRTSTVTEVAVAPLHESVEDVDHAQFAISPILVEYKDERKSYVKQGAIKAFLTQVRDGQEFSHRTIHPSDDFAGTDYYLILRWMREHGLVEKVPGGPRYIIKSVQALKDEYNSLLDQCKI